MVGAGAIGLTVVSLSVHSAFPAVQEAGCCVLRNISAGPANKAAVGTAGGIEAVRQHARTHSLSPTGSRHTDAVAPHPRLHAAHDGPTPPQGVRGHQRGCVRRCQQPRDAPSVPGGDRAQRHLCESGSG